MLFGPGDGFFTRFATLARMLPVMPLAGADTRFQPVYAGDVAEAIAQAVDGAAPGGRVYELGGPKVRTLRELVAYVLATTERKRVLLPLPWPVARAQGSVIGFLDRMSLGLMPDDFVITRDQVTLLERDNVVSEEAKREGRTLEGLGIAPTPFEAIVPSYLVRFRKSGQFFLERTAVRSGGAGQRGRASSRLRREPTVRRRWLRVGAEQGGAPPATAEVVLVLFFAPCMIAGRTCRTTRLLRHPQLGSIGELHSIGGRPTVCHAVTFGPRITRDRRKARPGGYRLKRDAADLNGHANFDANGALAVLPPLRAASFEIGRSRLYAADCFEWLSAQAPRSIQAIVTDPPYGTREYTAKEQAKLRSGKGGVWRIPPAFDGHRRAPLPRFTVLDDRDRQDLHRFFVRFGRLVGRVTVPGANVVIASNPLLAHVVTSAMSEAGLEARGFITRLVMTMRGGDRPKNAHEEFPDVSVMPRSMHEPWIVMRNPLDGRVQDNLRRWKTGGFRRISADRPFCDVIRSSPTPKVEKNLAPHPSLKPQAFLRHVVRGVLPLGTGIVLDPFAGSGSTLAAANAIGYVSIGIESDPHYVAIAATAIAPLSRVAAGPGSAVLGLGREPFSSSRQRRAETRQVPPT